MQVLLAVSCDGLFFAFFLSSVMDLRRILGGISGHEELLCRVIEETDHSALFFF